MTTKIEEAAALLMAADAAQAAYHAKAADASTSPYARGHIMTAERKTVEINHAIRTLHEFGDGYYGDYIVVVDDAPVWSPVYRAFLMVFFAVLFALVGYAYAERSLVSECATTGKVEAAGKTLVCRHG